MPRYENDQHKIDDLFLFIDNNEDLYIARIPLLRAMNILVVAGLYETSTCYGMWSVYLEKAILLFKEELGQDSSPILSKQCRVMAAKQLASREFGKLAHHEYPLVWFNLRSDRLPIDRVEYYDDYARQSAKKRREAREVKRKAEKLREQKRLARKRP